ncbi:Pentatricopeptide repeat-containing protein [Penicillium rolfsii]|nr:Pentatricopeptide repeat-containing protein [Penicillium rolfsii]
MLERAAGCLESAGRRFLRDPNGSFRSQRSLSRHFWKHNAAGGDIASCFVALVLPPGQQSSTSAFLSPAENKAAKDGNSPFLDFLYPQRAQELAASRLSRHSKRLALRRRRRTVVAFSRQYTSNASSPTKQILVEGTHTNEPNQQAVGMEAIRSSKGYLINLLEKQQAEYDRAWVLYIAAGRPSDCRSALCAYLSRSKDPLDRDRTWETFQGIPEDVLSENDFLRAAESQIESRDPSKLIALCEQALERGYGTKCCTLSFTRFWKARNWRRALEIWRLVSQYTEQVSEPPHRILFSELEHGRLAWDAVAFGKFVMREQSHDSRSLADFLLGHIFRYSYMLRSASTGILVELFRIYHELGFLKPEHYLHTITVFQASDARSIFIRTIVFYRIMRRHMPETTPPQSFFSAQLRAFASFGITSGVRFFLDEMRHFYGKPHLQLYKDAMQSFAHAGDVEKVHFFFDRLVEDHGPPRSRKLLAPLLDVYARTGNVEETTKQFERISEEFHLQPNTVCWNILLKAYANEENLAGALSIFSKMQQAGVSPSPHTFGTLMALFAKRGDIDNTRHLLKEAERHDVEITMPMLDMVVQAYCANGLLPQAEQFAVACQEFQVQGSPLGMWNTLLFQYAFRVDFVAMNRIWKHIKSAGIRPDAISYASHMLVQALVGKTDRARKTLRDLHKKRVLQATDLHYAIILYGYVKSRNRTMVQVIFNEIEERFGQPGARSSLLELRGQIEHDLETQERSSKPGADLRLKNAEQTLLNSLTSIDRLTKSIRLSSSKAHLSGAFQDSYYTYRIKNFGLNGAIDEARQLFQEYIDTKKTIGPRETGSESAPIRLIAAMMLAYLRAEQYSEVEECWQLAFTNTIKIASRVDLDEFMRPESSVMTDVAAIEPLPESDQPLSPLGLDGQEELTDSSDASLSRSHRRSEIIPSKRFALSRPLSIYMRALAYQNKTDQIIEVVTKFEDAGFRLSTFNWSTYVQMLAASDRFGDVEEAFRAFERTFMPNFPDWKRLQVGQGLKPLGVPFTIQQLEDPRHFPPPSETLGKASKSYWSHIDPGFMQPTYVSMVYLAAAVDRIRDLSILKGGKELVQLHSVAPKTIAEIGKMPYLRDKFQGVLLRHRSHQADKDGQKRPRRQTVAASGILGIRPRNRHLGWSQQAELPVSPTLTLSADAEAERTRQAVFGPSESDSHEDIFSVEDRADLEGAIRGRHSRHIYLKKRRASSKTVKHGRAPDLRAAAQEAEKLKLETKKGEPEDATPTEELAELAQDAKEIPEPLDEKTR